MSSFASLVKIDAERAVSAIETCIQRETTGHSSEGVIIGLSGGLDSAVLTALTVRALGKEQVHVYHLYDRESRKLPRQRAKLVANWLGLALEVENIEPALKEKQIYQPLIMRLTSLSGSLNRLLATGYRCLCGETCFGTTLHKGKLASHGLGRFFYNHVSRHIDAAASARHIYRRELLEKVAKEKDCLLLGAANRSEFLTGWFVKGGIDDVPLSPLVGIYKTQVRQIAEYLAVPEEIRTQAPSPDMVKGVSDEYGLCVAYSTLDVILDGVERDLTDEQIAAAGIDRQQISRFRKIVELSAWKRGSGCPSLPVDGRFDGGFRICNKEISGASAVS